MARVYGAKRRSDDRKHRQRGGCKKVFSVGPFAPSLNLTCYRNNSRFYVRLNIEIGAITLSSLKNVTH